PPGLQTTLHGVNVTVTVRNTTVECFLYYLSPGQIDAVLPGNTPVGLGTLTVTNNGQRSAPVGINVAASAFGILSYNDTLAAAYDLNYQLLTPANSANPSQTIVLWGSGIGRDPANDDAVFPQKLNNLTGIEMHAFIGGTDAMILYRGRSQYPGVDVIVLTIPPNTATGCYTSLVVVTGTIVSNSTTIPISASGKMCSDSNAAFAPAELQALAGKGTVKQATLVMDTARNAYADFQEIGNFGASIGSNSVSIGSCLVLAPTNSSSTTSSPLDAGPEITLSSPTGSTVTLNPSTATSYRNADPLPGNFFPVGGGTFTFDNGAGGNNVGHFSAALHFPALSFLWMNQEQITTVNRAQGLAVSWSGASGDSYVQITGGATSLGGSSTFVCQAPQSAGTFAVPSWVTLSMPPGPVVLIVELVSKPIPFSAPGLDIVFTRALIMNTKPVRFN